MVSNLVYALVRLHCLVENETVKLPALAWLR
jgi:hypothetical protein